MSSGGDAVGRRGDMGGVDDHPTAKEPDRGRARAWVVQSHLKGKPGDRGVGAPHDALDRTGRRNPTAASTPPSVRNLLLIPALLVAVLVLVLAVLVLVLAVLVLAVLVLAVLSTVSAATRGRRGNTREGGCQSPQE
jgi:Flp pilus assembly protein TadB